MRPPARDGVRAPQGGGLTGGGPLRWLPWPFALVLVVWTVLRLAGLERDYPAVAVIAWTPYAPALAAGTVLLALAVRARAAALVALACGVALAAAVLPRAVSDGADGSGDLTVMTANVFVGEVPAEWIVAAVRRHDVELLSLQELTPAAVAQLEAAGIRRLLPHAVVEPAAGARGTALYSTLPMRGQPPEVGTHLQAVADVRGVGRAVAVHTAAPTAREHDRWAVALQTFPRAEILAGDFNATLDHALLREVLDDGYRDAAAQTGDGLRPTWPDAAWPPPVTIDHVLYRPPWKARRVEVLDMPASDHRAVVAHLVR